MESLKDQKVQMVKCLKAIVVPEIKALGFSGSFPHFRREKKGRYEFLSFQFNRYGGSFVMECRFATRSQLPQFARELPFNKLNYGHAGHSERIRPANSDEGFWFEYKTFTYNSQFEDLAGLVVNLTPTVKDYFELN